MKKATGVLAFILAIVLLLIYRQLTAANNRADRPKPAVSAAVEVSLVLSSLLLP
jgi:hypothetical protein